jgi:hypothetical protein
MSFLGIDIDLGDVVNFAAGGLPGLVGGKALGALGLPSPGGFLADTLFPPDAPQPKALTPPPPVPDATDQAVRLARLSQRRRQMIGEGIGQTFFSGPLGDQSKPATAKPALGGY